MVTNPEAVLDAVRDGFSDWTNVAGEGVPSFTFVANARDADIPVVWETEPSGDWYIAHCAMDVNLRQRRFGVSRILVLARYHGDPHDLETLYQTMLHEVGHALGLGHSPYRDDIMYASVGVAKELSPRDRETLRKLYARPSGHPLGGALTGD
jgi:predicted Zn-dependent protease